MCIRDRRDRYLNKLMPDINKNVFPKDDMEHVELEVEYGGRDYQVLLGKVSMEGSARLKKYCRSHGKRNILLRFI